MGALFAAAGVLVSGLALAGEPTGALWIQPTSAALVMGVSPLNGYDAVYLPLGGQWAFPERDGWSAAFEVAALRLRRLPSGTGADELRGVWLSVGALFAEPTKRSGGFVQPKAVLGGFTSYRQGREDAFLLELHGGVDFGYQVFFDRLYLAFFLGISVGGCSGCATTFGGPLVGPPGNGRGGLLFNLNLNLLRVGWAF